MFAAPLLVSVHRQTCHCDLLQGPVARVQSLPRPLPVNCRVPKHSAMGCADLVTVVESPVRIIVAFGTRSQRRFRRTEFCSAVFCMTGDTTNAGSGMRFNHGGDKSFCVMTLRTIFFHAAGNGMAGGAGVAIGLDRNRRKNTELSLRMCPGYGTRCKSTRVPVSRRDRKQTHGDRAPDKKRHWPMRLQITGGSPVKCCFACASVSLGEERRRPHHLACFTNSLVPKNVERLVALNGGRAGLGVGLFFAGRQNRF